MKKICSTSNDILKSVAPFLSAQPAFHFIYNGDMAKLKLDDTLPTTSFSYEQTTGNPLIKRSYTTAYVQFNDIGKNIYFCFNKYFAETLNDIERSFVFAHEAMHVLLDHGKRGEDFLKTLPENERRNDVLNMAMDITINEPLLNIFFNDKIEYMDIIEDLCSIDSIFTVRGISVEKDKGFEYYYKKILEIKDFSGSGYMTFSDVIGDAPDWAKDIMEEIAEESGFNDSNIQDRLNPSNSSAKDSNGSGMGDAAQKVVTKYIKMTVEDAISRYIKPRNMPKKDHKSPDKIKYKWYGINRRIVVLDRVDPKINTPIRLIKSKDKKMNVIVYCDVSGSVASYTEKFLGLIDKIDKEKCIVNTFVWADKVGIATKKDNDKFTWVNVGGGTNINSVLNHYKSNFKDCDVDSIVVLTDGQYDDITKYKTKNSFDPTRWSFFMTPGASLKNVLDKSVSVEIIW